MFNFPLRTRKHPPNRLNTPTVRLIYIFHDCTSLWDEKRANKWITNNLNILFWNDYYYNLYTFFLWIVRSKVRIVITSQPPRETQISRNHKAIGIANMYDVCTIFKGILNYHARLCTLNFLFLRIIADCVYWINHQSYGQGSHYQHPFYDLCA